jgi:acetyl-CoA carboxylase biotin carboxyl carrier protein
MTDVRAELTASVFKIEAVAGDQVADGDTLMILESMKMEIPVLATGSGKILEVLVAEGEMVDEGAVVARLEP